MDRYNSLWAQSLVCHGSQQEWRLHEVAYKGDLSADSSLCFQRTSSGNTEYEATHLTPDEPAVYLHFSCSNYI